MIHLLPQECFWLGYMSLAVLVIFCGLPGILVLLSLIANMSTSKVLIFKVYQPNTDLLYLRQHLFGPHIESLCE